MQQALCMDVGIVVSDTWSVWQLSGNMLGKAFCWGLRAVIMRHPTLQSIRLESNEIGDDAAFSLGAALKRNPNNVVTSLHLGWNT